MLTASQVHSYHSYVALQQDSDAGLIGPQIVYAAGQMNSTMANYREFPLLYMIYDEADSWLSGQNKAALQNGGSSQQGQGPSGGFRGGSGGSGGSSGGSSYPGNGAGGGSGGANFGNMDTQNLYSANTSVWKPQVTNLAGSGQVRPTKVLTRQFADQRHGFSSMVHQASTQ